MKKLIYISMILLLLSCDNKDKKEIHYYLGENNLLGIIKENRFLAIEHAGYFIEKKIDSNDCKDYILTSNNKFIIKTIEDISYDYDTLFLANNWCELRSDYGVIYNAKIYNDTWNISVYWPKERKGNYRFKISEKENDLFKAFLNKSMSIKASIFPEQHVIDSLFIMPGSRCFELYIGVSKGNVFNEYYGIGNYLPKEIDLLSQLSSIIIKDRLKNIRPITKKIGLQDVRDKFNDMEKKTRYDYFFLEDFDSMSAKVPLPDD